MVFEHQEMKHLRWNLRPACVTHTCSRSALGMCDFAGFASVSLRNGVRLVGERDLAISVIPTGYL